MLQSRQLAKWIIALLLLFPLAGLLPSTTPVKAYSLPHVVITDCSSGQNIANAFGTYTPIWQSGGTISFNCGNSPVTIPVTTTLQYYGYYPDQNVLTIDGGGLVTLDGLSTPTIFKGVNLNLENINLTRSNSGQGRGIEVGNLNMSNVTISNQTDSAIFARTAYITNSTFYNNSSATQGGAISIYPLDLVIWINGSSFISNTANQGGAIYAPGSLLYVVNSTISGNKATDKGGAIYAQSHAGGIEIHNTTIYNNEANFGGGFFFSTAQAEFANTIIAGNHSLAITDTNTNCFGNFAMTDFGNNLEDNNTCNFSNANHDLINTDPNLSPLGNYGGPTKTHLLLPGSPAIDAGNNDICLHQTFLDNLYLPPWQYNIDQRGIPRPQGAACDIGAVEALPFLPGLSQTFTPPGIVSNGNTSLTFNLYNPNQVSLTNLTFTDTLPAQLSVATLPGLTNNCGSGTLAAVGGGGSFTLSGVTLGPKQGCTVGLNVTSSTLGNWTNTTGLLSVTELGSTPVSATASLRVLNSLVVTNTTDAPANPQNGSLRQVLAAAGSDGAVVTFDPILGNSPVITLTVPLLIPAGTLVEGSCLNQVKLSSTFAGAVQLQGNNWLSGLKISSSLGPVLKTNGTGNRLQCITVLKTN